MYKLLDKINAPADLRRLSPQDLPLLCSEIRDYIIQCTSQRPGHLASSLGAVELIVGAHYVFDTPNDKLLFDVGHQAYAHKILTGRREAMKSLRTSEGPSGFPNPFESEYDSFVVGHSSTSISAALGFAEAFRLQGTAQKVVDIIGDGAMTGGLAFEGLNNAGSSKADLLVILNDNDQSIEPNLGAMHNHLLKLTTNASYNRFKNKVWNLLGDGAFRTFIQRWVKSVKSWVVGESGGDLFEALGFRYFGPIDGNNIAEVISTLSRIKDLKGPRLLHCHTLKGKGFAPAEKDPVTWHAPGKFDPQTGLRQVSSSTVARYQDVFGEVLLELAQADSKVVGITPAMAQGSGMCKLAKALPAQFFDVGIEEDHAVTFSAGLAAAGMKPFCNIYSAFSQRAYDQIIHDVALQRLPLVLCFDRAGLVGEDGATHHGAFDLAAYRSVPGVIISSPRSEKRLKDLMYTAYQQTQGPFIIRYPRGRGEGEEWKSSPASLLPIGKAECLLEGKDVAFVGIGPVVNRALEVARKYMGKVGVYDFTFIKPFDTQTLTAIAQKYSSIITLEDGCLKGGLYGAVCESLQSMGISIRVEGIGISDEFARHASVAEQWARYGLDCKGIEKRLQKVLGIGK